MRGKKKKSWKDMTPGQRVGLVVVGSGQLALLVAAQRSISKTPAAQIRGNKALWRAACFINFFGPLSYFLFGRRRGTA
jgi:phospholipase D-like protein